MEAFIINGIEWKIQFVSINNPKLRRSNGTWTIGMTDWNTTTIYLADGLHGGMLEKVLCHELCHCFCFSYEIHIDLDQEEFLADWIATYGRDVIELLDKILFDTHKIRLNYS